MAKNNKLFQKVNKALSSGQFIKAINGLQKLLEDSPLHIEYLLLMGEALMRNEQFAEAVVYFAKVVELEKNNIRALNNFGAALLRNRRLEEAKEILLYALDIDPENIDLYTNLGSVYQNLLLPEKSLEAAFKVVELNPSWYMAYNNLGCALGDLMRLDDAREAYITANLLNPKFLPTILNLAQLEVKLGNHSRGVELYESALKLTNLTNGEQELIKYYLSHSYLYFGNLTQGWIYYDFGFSDMLPTGAYRSQRKFSQPLWKGNLNEQKTVLIWREQGIGDELLFGTCLEDVHNSNLNIILECDPRLIDIYQRTFPKFRVRGESIDSQFRSQYADFEFHIPIGSLPRYFRSNIKDFDKPPKLFIPKIQQTEFISEKLKPYRDKILVGICWRSGRLSIERNLNYTSLRDWGSLLADPRYQFVNLFHEDCENEILEVEQLHNIRILRWNDINLKNDLETVLALVSQLDCVVSVGTAVSIIAASSGANTLVLMQRSWVLLGQENKYPWFPNVHPFVVETNQHVGANIDKLGQYIKFK